MILSSACSCSVFHLLMLRYFNNIIINFGSKPIITYFNSKSLKMKIKLPAFVFITAIALFACNRDALNNKQSEKPNILFIAVDDLRPELNCYGVEGIHSPNIDQLASEGILFNRAYCNIPVCGASRASIMTGLRPARERFLYFYTRADEDAPGVACLSQHFKNNGYTTISNGKVFHHQDDRAESWDDNWRPRQVTTWRDYQLPENIRKDTSGQKRGPAFEMADLLDTAYFDGKIAAKAIRDLEKLKDSENPFFLAVGFLKPHLPFNAPKKYYDLYPFSEIQLPDNNYKPEGAPDVAMHNFGELRAYEGIPGEGPVSDSAARRLIQGYHACVSYTDAQIGKVLKALDQFGLKENTIVILWGDHGWNLREHGLWCKHCLFQTSLRSTLVLSVPWLNQGIKTDRLVEFVDIYPTLCELAGLEKPAHLEGLSFAPLIDDPLSEWKEGVISQWFDGLTVNTDRYSYTEWSDTSRSVYNSMMYDHLADWDENVNISKNPDNQEIIPVLREILNENRGEDYWK